MADPDLGLDRPRPMDHPDDPPVRCRRCRRSAHRRPTSAGGPPATRRTAARPARPRPGRRGRRRPRASPGAGRGCARRRGRRSAAVSRSTVSRVPPDGRWYGDAGGVDGLGERLLGAPSRIGLGLEQVVEALVAQALDLGRREGRPQQDLRDQLERRRQPVGRHLHARAQRVPAGIRVDRGAQPLGGLDQLRSRRSARCLRTGRGPRARCCRPARPAPRARRRERPPTPRRAAARAGRRRGPTGRSTTGATATDGKSYGRGGPTGRTLGDHDVVGPGSSVVLMPPPPRRVARRLPARRRVTLVGGGCPRAGRSAPAGCPAGRPRPPRRGSPPG